MALLEQLGQRRGVWSAVAAAVADDLALIAMEAERHVTKWALLDMAAHSGTSG